eukprot:TRINITY_DN25299_c0_g1_i2.p1 TRINITY_DN25299_c0_g1~~TRINITY_DN25299_c0_g1_i2.p1  ORF type:complete len:263 (+),score=35.09 TRINITY_DN25299_c0_g1_i2:181-969(+)
MVSTSSPGSRDAMTRRLQRRSSRQSVRFQLQLGGAEGSDSEAAASKPLNRSRSRRPTPCAGVAAGSSLPSRLQFARLADDDDVGDDQPQDEREQTARRVRDRIPTPFQHASLAAASSVQFGLTEVMDSSQAEQLPMPRRRRIATPVIEQPVLLGSEALAERVPTPRGAAPEEAESPAVSCRTFDEQLPQRRCSGADECAVCQESLSGQDAKLFPCGHFYHSECILQWFQRQVTCPLCRRSFRRELRRDSSPSSVLQGRSISF